jgi:hypothetical protein
VNHSLLHPLCSSRPIILLRLVRAWGCSPRFWPRLCFVGLMCLLRQPFIWLESARYGARIRTQPIERDPVFIIGHWRSGTTHLQNLISQDPQFGGVTLLQAAMPNDFLTLSGSLTPILQKMLPKTRLMDRVRVGCDAPWEEEMALACTGRLSFYHVSFFPDHVEEIFREAVQLNGGDPKVVAEWRQQYLAFLRKVQFTQPDRRLLLKNPANTARIAQLRQMFSRARFIHIHRNPYKVFASTIHLYLKAQQAWGLQLPNRERVVRHVLKAYRSLMKAYFADRGALGPAELVEVSFQGLQQDPIGTLDEIYRTIELPGFESARPAFERYIDSQRHYCKNALELSVAESRQVRRDWRNSFDQFGYAI